MGPESAPPRPPPPLYRCLQLTLGIVSLVAVANYQYSWTLFVRPLQEQHPWSREQVLRALSCFLGAQTLLMPVESYLAERFGPRRLLVVGGVLAALGWALCART